MTWNPLVLEPVRKLRTAAAIVVFCAFGWLWQVGDDALAECGGDDA